ncbi:hypothetical protein ACQ4PT_031516 [Festuca glaucescens]
MGYSFHGKGNGSCKTGDCSGLLPVRAMVSCPNTLIEFALDQFASNDFFDISLIDGFNVPMDFLPVPVPVQGRSGYKRPHCAANITLQCPSELKAPGGCKDACTLFNQDKYCCAGNKGPCCSQHRITLNIILYICLSKN